MCTMQREYNNSYKINIFQYLEIFLRMTETKNQIYFNLMIQKGKNSYKAIAVVKFIII